MCRRIWAFTRLPLWQTAMCPNLHSIWIGWMFLGLLSPAVE